MTEPLLPRGDGHTALSDEDRHGLIPSYIATRGDLYEAEQRGVVGALLRRPPGLAILLDDKYLRDLHRAMFGEVWRWAGRYRTRETNIGVAPAAIPVAVRTLVDDVARMVDARPHSADEIAVRFHHRLVAIHPFPNGNGRHSRIAADYLIQAIGGAPFSWGRNLGVDTDDLRRTYHLALRRADGGEIGALMDFARA